MRRVPTIGTILALLAAGQAAAQSITVSKPAAGETWYRNVPHTIQWTIQNYSPQSVAIKLVNPADTATVLTIADNAPNTGSFQWPSIPASVVAGPYRVKVVVANQWSGKSGQFTVADAQQAQLRVTSPNGGESWQAQATKPITWTPGGATGTVKIELYRNGTAPNNKLGVIASSVAASAGTHPWTVGSYQGGTAPTGGGYRVKVIATTPPLQDASDGSFTIAEQGPQHEAIKAPIGSAAVALVPLRVLEPTHASQWTVGTPATIRWQASDAVKYPLWLFLVSSDHKIPIVDIGKYGNQVLRPTQIQWTPTDNLYDGEYCVRITSADEKEQVHSAAFRIASSRIAKFDVGPPAVTNKSHRHEVYVVSTAFGEEFIAAHMPTIPDPGGATIKYGYQRWYEDGDNHGYRFHRSYVKFDVGPAVAQLKHKFTVKLLTIQWAKAPNSPQVCSAVMFALDAPMTDPHGQLFGDAFAGFPKHPFSGGQATQTVQRWLEDPAKNYGLAVVAQHEGQTAENGQCVEFATIVLKLEIEERLGQ